MQLSAGLCWNASVPSISDANILFDRFAELSTLPSADYLADYWDEVKFTYNIA
jgi:hypothetical protein